MIHSRDITQKNCRSRKTEALPSRLGLPHCHLCEKKIWNEYEEKLGYKCDYILEVDTTEDY